MKKALFIILSWVSMALMASVILFMMQPANSGSEQDDNIWRGWTNQAAFLARHYDPEFGVVCYLSSRSGQMSSRDPSLSCVKL